VDVTRHTKSKKSRWTNFEIFRVHEPGVPVESIEIKEPEFSVKKFAFEPHGKRFAYVTGEAPRFNIFFHTLASKQVKELATLTKRPVNNLHWSPRGEIILLAGNSTAGSGQLEWWDVTRLEMIGTDEHFMCTEVEWDPTGRYVVTYVSALKQSLENGYAIWTSSGRLLNKIAHPKLHQFAWRPRPPSLLTPEMEQHIRKSLKEKYQKRFEREDAARIGDEDDTIVAKRLAQRKRYLSYVAKNKALYQQQAESRRILRRARCPSDSEELFQTYQETQELVLAHDEVVVPST